MNNILFTKLLWSGDSERTFRSSSQAATYHLSITHGGSFTLSLLALNVKQGSYEYQFLYFGLTRPGIEPESNVSEADVNPLNHWSVFFAQVNTSVWIQPVQKTINGFDAVLKKQIHLIYGILFLENL